VERKGALARTLGLGVADPDEGDCFGNGVVGPTSATAEAVHCNVFCGENKVDF